MKNRWFMGGGVEKISDVRRLSLRIGSKCINRMRLYAYMRWWLFGARLIQKLIYLLRLNRRRNEGRDLVTGFIIKTEGGEGEIEGGPRGFQEEEDGYVEAVVVVVAHQCVQAVSKHSRRFHALCTHIHTCAHLISHVRFHHALF